MLCLTYDSLICRGTRTPRGSFPALPPISFRLVRLQRMRRLSKRKSHAPHTWTQAVICSFIIATENPRESEPWSTRPIPSLAHLPLLPHERSSGLGASRVLTFLGSHLPLGLGRWSALPFTSSSIGYKLSSKATRHSRATVVQVSFAAFVLLLFLLQIIHTPRTLFTPSIPEIHSPISATCLRDPAFPTSPPVCTISKMGLIEDARKVAEEFEYPGEKVNKGVKEFIRQMG